MVGLPTLVGINPGTVLQGSQIGASQGQALGANIADAIEAMSPEAKAKKALTSTLERAQLIATNKLISPEGQAEADAEDKSRRNILKYQETTARLQSESHQRLSDLEKDPTNIGLEERARAAAVDAAENKNKMEAAQIEHIKRFGTPYNEAQPTTLAPVPEIIPETGVALHAPTIASHTVRNNLTGIQESSPQTLADINQALQPKPIAEKLAILSPQSGTFGIHGEKIPDEKSKQTRRLEEQKIEIMNKLGKYHEGVTTWKEIDEELAKAKGRGASIDTETGDIISGPTDAQGHFINALNGLDDGDRELIKAIANYDIPTKQIPAINRLEFLKRAHLYDNDFRSSEYDSKAKLRQDFVSGKSAQNKKSINTAISHLDKLREKGDALKNAPFPVWNAIKNKGLSEAGYKEVTGFNAAATAVEGELASVFKGTGATDQEIKAWKANINSSQSPQQIEEAIITAMELMHGRLDALDFQYTSGMNKPRDFSILDDSSRKILKKVGIDSYDWDPVKDKTTAASETPSQPQSSSRGKSIIEKYNPAAIKRMQDIIANPGPNDSQESIDAAKAIVLEYKMYGLKG